MHLGQSEDVYLYNNVMIVFNSINHLWFAYLVMLCNEGHNKIALYAANSKALHA